MAAGLSVALLLCSGKLVTGRTVPSFQSRDTTRSPALSDTAAAVHLLRRATFGARPVDVTEVLALGREAWLDRQLHPERIPDSSLKPRLALYPAATMSPGELYAAYPPKRLVQRDMRVQTPRRMLFDLVGAKLQRAIYSERQLQEVMTDFWFNHFNVFWGKAADRWLVADYEREAIRPFVFGKFEDMLVATASHPAMLVYLDNWRSSVPDSLNPARGRTEARRRRRVRLSSRQQDRVSERARKRPRGINENYARELLELHALGVDGGYTQEDVMEVARAFTGWTLTRLPELSFRFRPEMHDRGSRTVLGHSFPAGGGMESGLEILHLLAHHPSTARHLATGLVEAFVTDDPPPDLVDELAAVFLQTDGDLREVTRALFTSQRFFDPAHYGGKLKSPFELVASALRTTEAEVGPSRALVQQLRAFGHLPYLSPVPTGYPESTEDWATTGAMLQRMNFGLALARGELGQIRLEDGFTQLDGMLRALLPGVDTDALREAIMATLRDGTDSRDTQMRRALGLALGSPEFQTH